MRTYSISMKAVVNSSCLISLKTSSKYTTSMLVFSQVFLSVIDFRHTVDTPQATAYTPSSNEEL